jgi:hypothetical protein
VPLHEPTKLLIRGDGANIKVSQNFFDFESEAITNALPAGNGVASYVIGEYPTTDMTVAQCDFFWLSLYSSNLNQTQLDTMAACLRSRAGDQA